MSSLKPKSISIGGFTLIELLVVIAILSILAVIGVSTYANAQKAGRDGKRISDMEEIQKAVEQYYALNQKYPMSNGDTSATLGAAVNSYFGQAVMPNDPTQTGLDGYTYLSCAANNRYNICAKLESCGGKCNIGSTLPANGCTSAPASATGNTWFCRSNISTN